MIYPSIDKLLNQVGSKYLLVNIVARRAQEMKETDHYQMKENEYVSKKEIGKALEEVSKDLIHMKKGIKFFLLFRRNQMIIPATAVAAVLGLIYAFWWVFLIFIIIVLVKIYIQVKKYGARSAFRLSQKNIENEQMNLVEHILKKQNKYIIKIDNNKLICISTSGIYLIKILEYIGRIEGEEENTLY